MVFIQMESLKAYLAFKVSILSICRIDDGMLDKITTKQNVMIILCAAQKNMLKKQVLNFSSK
jgi:hypothetical protein